MVSGLPEPVGVRSPSPAALHSDKSTDCHCIVIHRACFNVAACSRRDLSLNVITNSWMKTQIPKINAVRSAWRRVKKDIKDAIIRDLSPVKDVKGGGGGGKSPQGGGKNSN